MNRKEIAVNRIKEGHVIIEDELYRRSMCEGSLWLRTGISHFSEKRMLR